MHLDGVVYNQGWISEMRIDAPTCVPKSKWVIIIFTNLGQRLSQKVVVFSLIFEPILRAGFFDRILSLSNKKSTFQQHVDSEELNKFVVIT